MKTIKRGDTPFNTNNAILAYCLHMAGVPWHDENRPLRVLYSVDILNKFANGSGEPMYKGWPLEDAVRDAHNRGLRGYIQYVFQRVPRLETLLGAYRRQSQEIEQGTGYAHELVARVSKAFGQGNDDVAMVRLACIFLKMRLPFMAKWQDMIPDVIIKNEGRVTRQVGADGGKTISGPGFKMLPLNASKELKEKFGL